MPHPFHERDPACRAGAMFRKFGSFLEELAVLILVFVPLDIWQGKLTFGRTAAVVLTSGGLFLIGLGCHWTVFILNQDQKGMR